MMDQFADLLGLEDLTPDDLQRSPSEKKIQNDALVGITALPETMAWRHNTGQAWQGRAVDVPVGHTIRVTPGMKILADARPVKFGLEGSADVIGATRRKPLAVELKTATGPQRTAQLLFERAWTKVGGIYILARSADEAIERTRKAAQNGT